MSVKQLVKSIIPAGIMKAYRDNQKIRYFNTRKHLDVFEFHVAEHCNLNCAACDHFSPLAREEYVDIAVVEKDMERLAGLTNGCVKEIRLLGGEPLLHKDITSIFVLVRKYFTNSRILLFTNAILLPGQSDAFWQYCKDNRIDIMRTQYPIKLDIEAISARCKKYGLSFTNSPGIRENEMYHCVLEPAGNGNVKYNWRHCLHNQWTFLRNGRIYPCPFYANIPHFNRYFNKNLPLTEKDSIDIHQAKDVNEILDFLKKPIPACRYCDIAGYTYGHKWGISKKDIGEWT
ncbi:hypothetical protein FACS189442_2390 [Spirochaetia bacterium]|nr:hypothetical protein FACS189442_2390 [Spirochaetia bacterium]